MSNIVELYSEGTWTTCIITAITTRIIAILRIIVFNTF